MVQRSQTTAPSLSRTSATTPRAFEAGGAPSVKARLGRAATTERPEEEDQRRAEQDDEHRWEDQEHEREQDLDRRPLCLFLSGRLSTASHLQCQVTHDLADRHAERLALDNGADERPH